MPTPGESPTQELCRACSGTGVLETAQPAETDEGVETGTHDARFVHWPEFWDDDIDAEQWAIYPLVPDGRGVSLYAPAKAGKSTVVLAAVAAAASGKPGLLGGRSGDPVDVVYLDYEMTKADLRERLETLGFGPDDNLDRLHYALIPSLPPLDTKEGAAAVVDMVQATGARVVVVDTYGRAVAGDENEADTTKDFYRWTGTALKAMGVACLRCDHAGKDLDKGQRGSSAKNDDVDVVWRLTRTEGGVKISRTHSRVPWVPETIELDYREDDETGMVRLVPLNRKGYVAGTKEAADALDALGVPVSVTARRAQAALRDAGKPTRMAVVNDAVRHRKERSDMGQDGLETGSETAFETVDRPKHRNQRESFTNDQVRGTETFREPSGNGSAGKGGNVTPPIGGNVPSPTPAEALVGIDSW